MSDVILVTRLMVRAELNRLGLKPTDVTNEDIDNALAQVDQASVLQNEIDKYGIVLWDRQTPVNGVPAEQVIAGRPDMLHNGAIYLVTNAASGAVLYIQPTDPETGAIMDEAAAMESAQKFVRSIASAQAKTIILQMALRMIGIL